VNDQAPTAPRGTSFRSTVGVGPGSLTHGDANPPNLVRKVTFLPADVRGSLCRLTRLGSGPGKRPLVLDQREQATHRLFFHGRLTDREVRIELITVAPPRPHPPQIVCASWPTYGGQSRARSTTPVAMRPYALLCRGCLRASSSPRGTRPSGGCRRVNLLPGPSHSVGSPQRGFLPSRGPDPTPAPGRLRRESPHDSSAGTARTSRKQLRRGLWPRINCLDRFPLASAVGQAPQPNAQAPTLRPPALSHSRRMRPLRPACRLLAWICEAVDGETPQGQPDHHLG
jgi:hypothetical protein